MLKWTYVLSLLTLFIGGAALAAPSFDCSRAGAAIEMVICDNPDLSALDAELSKSFSAARLQLDASHAEQLLRQQRVWLGARSVKCHVTKELLGSRDRMRDATGCLVELYRDRVNHLYALIARHGDWIEDITIDGETHHLIILKDPGETIAFFNQQSVAGKKPDRIAGCRLVVNVPLIHANNYGGVCSVERGGQLREAKVCADDMVGNFKIEDLPAGDLSAQDLARFVLANCTGG